MQIYLFFTKAAATKVNPNFNKEKIKQALALRYYPIPRVCFELGRSAVDDHNKSLYHVHVFPEKDDRTKPDQNGKTELALPIWKDNYNKAVEAPFRSEERDLWIYRMTSDSFLVFYRSYFHPEYFFVLDVTPQHAHAILSSTSASMYNEAIQRFEKHVSQDIQDKKNLKK